MTTFKDSLTVEAVQPYLVTAKTGKLSKCDTLAEWQEQAESPNDHRAKEYRISYEMHLTKQQWDELMTSLLDDRACFKGKGNNDCIMAYCGPSDFAVLDPQGSSFIRYVGLDVQIQM